MSQQLYALVGVIVVVVVAAALVLAVVLTGHTDPAALQLVTTVLGFAGTIILVLLGLAGLKAQVTDVHTAIDGRMTELVASTASNSRQLGVTEGLAQAAGAGPAAPDPPITEVKP